ncbi:DUF4834 domain-containing protein [Spirosoma rhododendri]|uniref:DUF4834 family protein n=1 Tax=Spirosoma rhododendri TaxID=2728024 RepID=A0A7L5DIG6_9BACT|nr:DUF4834 domain-containing protein [Spirosoma rhododendri]QJD78159.1 DUF4834 family protein [Spirosoma rhododendri]
MLFKYLFIITLIILFVPPVRRFVFYLLVGRQLVNQQKQANNVERRREGEIRVDNKPPKGDAPFKGGDYVDYEEVK